MNNPGLSASETGITVGHKKLVRETFRAIEEHGSIAALLFYRHLFTLEPSLRRLFSTDIEVQGRKLIDALAFIVATLDAPQAQAAALAGLGRRHAGYGARPEHYELVQDALMAMFEQDLGPAFTPEAREAWAIVYAFISKSMQQAAAQACEVSGGSQAVYR